MMLRRTAVHILRFWTGDGTTCSIWGKNTTWECDRVISIYLFFLLDENWLSTRKKKHRIPVEVMMSPGTMKDNPHAEETKAPAMRDPKMFPTEVCEFHTPMMNPRLTAKTTYKHSAASVKPLVIHQVSLRAPGFLLINSFCSNPPWKPFLAFHEKLT